MDQTAILSNGTLIGGLQSPPSAWLGAVVQAAIYNAAVQTQHESLAFQQLAVSHAAHNSLNWLFHGTRQYASDDAALASVLGAIGINASSTDGLNAGRIGRSAAL